MDPEHFPSRPNGHPVLITRTADAQWQAVADGHVVGHGDASRRPDGRIFTSIDVWRTEAFNLLADAMLAELPRPLFTVVDEIDHDLTRRWERVGFTTRRREWEYVVPTDPQVTGLHEVLPPSDVTILAAGTAEGGPLRAVDRVIRAEVGATLGWQSMPAEVLPLPAGITVVDPSTYVVAAQRDRYVGLARIASLTRQPRIGLIAVRADQQRRGIARALLAHVLGSLHRAGITAASAQVDASNIAAMALFDGVGAVRASSNLELVHRAPADRRSA